VIVVAGFWFGCSKDSVNDSGPEIWAGRLIVHNTPQSYPYTSIDTDQVSLAIDAGTYELNHLTRKSDLCDSYGVIRNFGLPTFRLVPSGADWDGSCDQQRIPSGDFTARFRGDSLTVGPDTQEVLTTNNGQTMHDTMIFLFQLTLR
jgi:hypothetical protein